MIADKKLQAQWAQIKKRDAGSKARSLPVRTPGLVGTCTGTMMNFCDR